MITQKLIQTVIDNYPLPIDGIHGIAHWVRVRNNGLRLAQITGANETVIKLFALFHDSQRRNEGSDYKHGPRGADLARSLHGSLFDLSESDLELLCTACENHTSLATHEDITIQTCFDADRLDLGRVGIIPDPDLLCTNAAKQIEMLEWAYNNSINGHDTDLSEQVRSFSQVII